MKKHILFGILVLAMAAFLPAFSAQAQTACTIDSFTALPSTVTAGASSTLTIKTSHCGKAILFGLNASDINQGFIVDDNGSVSSGAISSSRIFTLQASQGTSSPAIASLTINTNTAASTGKGFFATIIDTANDMAGLVANAVSSLAFWK